MKLLRFYNIELRKIVCFDQTFFDDYEQGGWNESRILSDGWYLQHLIIFNRVRSMLKTFAWMVDIILVESRNGEFFSILILYVIQLTAWTPNWLEFQSVKILSRGDDEDPDVKSTPCGYDEFEVQQFKRRGKMVTWTEENHTSDLGPGSDSVAKWRMTRRE